jgi:ribosomal protein L30/L7E
VRLRREARAAKGLRVDDEPKLAFAVRIRGLNKVHPKVCGVVMGVMAVVVTMQREGLGNCNGVSVTSRGASHLKTKPPIKTKTKKTQHKQTQKILQLLRLRQLGNGVFLQVNKSTLGLLKRVEPYIAWGYPNLATVRALVLKRGHAKVNGNRVPLTDNKVIEDALGDKGLICVEDLVHEVATVGPHFKAATNFLWPFKLNSARGGLGNSGDGGKRTHFAEGGQAGNHGERISALLKRMI